MKLPLQDILDGIREWNKVRKDRELATFYLSTARFFSFECADKGTSKYLHAYPGIYENKLYFFLIPSEFDSPDSKAVADIDAHINATQVHIGVGNGGQELPEKEAQERIDNWDNNVKEWVSVQIDAPEGIFQAFAIPTDYIKEKVAIPYDADFALRNSDVAVSGYIADLVIVDRELKKSVYYDTVRPVPPFAPLEGDFYLLQLAEN